MRKSAEKSEARSTQLQMCFRKKECGEPAGCQKVSSLANPKKPKRA